VDRGKQPAKETVLVPPKLNGEGASTSAIGGNGSWIPISVNSTVATTSRTMVPVPQTTHATSSQIPVNTISQSIPVSLPVVPVSDIASNSFSFSLHNVFDRIPTDELPLTNTVLEEVVSLVAHDDVQPVEVGRSYQTSREVLENPKMTDVTNPLLDSVDHNLVSPTELVESPKGSNERHTHSSPLGREDIRPNGVAQTNQTSREVLENPKVYDFSEPL
jgi:hypothetical protein